MAIEVFGVISDTHGLLRPEAANALEGCARILHAGDIGAPEILEQLGSIAPVTAVRGNVDYGAWADALPRVEIVEAGTHLLCMIHDLGELDLDAAAAGFRAVISGHSHRPAIEDRNDVLFLNPGSAGPRRFKLPISVALLELAGDAVTARILELA